MAKYINKLFEGINVSDEDIEIFKQLAIKYNVVDENNKYSFKVVKDIVLFHNKYVHKYLNTFGIVNALFTPYGRFKPKLSYIRRKATNKNYTSSIENTKKYVDWYNSIVNLYNNGNNNIGYLEYPKENNLVISNIEYSTNLVDNSHLLYKAVKIIDGTFANMQGIVIKVLPLGKIAIKLMDRENPIYTSCKNIHLITNLSNNII